jgi:3-hydroxyisobutyrate dehydrogenase-like beta-hydroxyacid dehydrogenase
MTVLHRSLKRITSRGSFRWLARRRRSVEAKTISLLHPGKMGVTIGAAAATSGARILWISQHRSRATRERAQRAGLIEVEKLNEAIRASDVILSVCPPHAALELARTVAAYHFTGVYVDANAVSRATAEEIGAVVSSAGATFVDGGIIGSPVEKAGTTRLYLSGDRADVVAQIFSKSLLEARAIGQTAGAASALKIAYAAWTKCTDALVLAIRAYSTKEGVDEALLKEWRMSPARTGRTLCQSRRHRGAQGVAIRRRDG